MLFIKDVKSNYFSYGLPYEFAECLPDVCSACGSLMVMNESLTHLRCSNPRCKDKIIQRIKAMCQSLGVLGFGESTIEKFVDYYGVTNPLNIFNLRVGMDLSEDISEEVSGKIISQLVKKKDFQLWEYVMIANIPGIQTSAKSIFSGYDSLEEAYNAIEAGGVPFIQGKLGIYNDGEISIMASKVYEALVEFKDDLFECLPDVNIVSVNGLPELEVVCSDQVGDQFSTKKEFYSYVADRYKGRVHVNFLGSVKRSIDYLIWAGADGSCARYTNKVKTVEGYNERGCSIPILTADQFIKELDGLYM